jgi:hypothetical protein
MNIDTGIAVVIVAVLIFYLRLIIIQRERVKRVSQSPATTSKKKKKQQQFEPGTKYSILSNSNRDRIIAGIGVFAILIGILLNIKFIPLVIIQPYWWIPTALGVVAFSWAFKL